MTSTEKVNQLDGLLTAITKILKKHWKILILISIAALLYWAFISEDEYYEDY